MPYPGEKKAFCPCARPKVFFSMADDVATAGAGANAEVRPLNVPANTVVVELKLANLVAQWYYKGSDDEGVCAICLNDLAEPCIDCVTDTSLLALQCRSLGGVCNHHFHGHCIGKYLRSTNAVSRNRCPLCQQPWETQTILQ